MVDGASESGSVFTLKRLWVILILVEDLITTTKFWGNFPMEPLGILEVLLGQGVKIGKGLFPEHSVRGTDAAHVLLDDSDPV